MSTVSVGNQAELAAAEYLARQGYEIVELNYRRKYCEIDVVAKRGDCIYLVEVKYRMTDKFGGGFDYITAVKIQHMTRAADVWVAEHRWQGEYDLAVIEVGGPDYEILECIESIY